MQWTKNVRLGLCLFMVAQNDRYQIGFYGKFELEINVIHANRNRDLQIALVAMFAAIYIT